MAKMKGRLVDRNRLVKKYSYVKASDLVLNSLKGKDLTKSHTLIIKKCPICDEFTSYDEWAKPQVACINCGVEE